MTRPQAAWLSVAVAITAADVWLDRGEPNGDTLSECIRAAWHTDHPIGRAAWALTLTAGAGWLHRHILREVLP